MNETTKRISPKYSVGDKVIAVRKTVGRRELDNAASYYLRVEMNQEFLYVNAIHLEESAIQGETCYWCNAILGAYGDSYRESDLIIYEGVE